MNKHQPVSVKFVDVAIYLIDIDTVASFMAKTCTMSNESASIAGFDIDKQ